MGGLICVVHDLLHQHLMSKPKVVNKFLYKVLNLVNMFIVKKTIVINDTNSPSRASTGYFIACEKYEAYSFYFVFLTKA